MIGLQIHTVSNKDNYRIAAVNLTGNGTIQIILNTRYLFSKRTRQIYY
jgi:hypothetical protein